MTHGFSDSDHEMDINGPPEGVIPEQATPVAQTAAQEAASAGDSRTEPEGGIAAKTSEPLRLSDKKQIAQSMTAAINRTFHDWATYRDSSLVFWAEELERNQIDLGSMSVLRGRPATVSDVQVKRFLFKLLHPDQRCAVLGFGPVIEGHTDGSSHQRTHPLLVWQNEPFKGLGSSDPLLLATASCPLTTAARAGPERGASPSPCQSAPCCI